MPFKTKRQKLKAAERRYTIPQPLPIDYQSLAVSTTNHEPQEKITISKALDFTSKQATSIEPNYNYVKMDLLKITILAGFISIFQILIFLYKNKLPIPF
ncbi:hypothetical protein A3I53_04470 [Candidatus Curtissbacteria bacterium RIFCSPLOWO2_02_FULL_40_13b]|uniref:Uncharacterized protein n=3 Tax=Candidatus Curtissiibacteriota TaxID=1752717 RepID=A0A1F5HVE7_9BACT|nr:MAG: hypothetical protein A2693_01815 [Candidatus Curtissbacteria bacterium RIFCSPHIGHO2_01_FULL_40_12]OGE03767.1 MAG: hypothetical protein A3F45_00570 [Candidatus Curtissbacteria bacterium RIFCSPHIGHO2_12_FULL_41_17]OGE08073.1 MAG: hypothetical protein A3I53_04470 [Candidatus Curtissbacteria bacterium RIFCSPLOWO2_02_FULL_40_13b]